MKTLRIGDLAVAVVVLVGLWLGWRLIDRMTDTGPVAKAFRSALHNPYGDDTPNLLDPLIKVGADLSSIQSTMLASRFACSIVKLGGPITMICQRDGNGGGFLCERRWQVDFLFAPDTQALTKLRAEARGEC